MQMIDVPTLGAPPPPSARTGAHLPPSGWRPDSWRGLPISQQPDWADPGGLGRVLGEISQLPPLVLPGEIEDLRAGLARVADGRAFFLQAGDCAERFGSCIENGVRGKLRLILQLAILLSYGSGLPVVKVGRIAGQFGKPRSSPTEIIDGVELPVYRGDIVNDTAPTRAARTPDVERLRSAYHHASATLNVLRALLREGFADLERVHAGNQEFVRRNPAARQHEGVAADIAWALRFMAACGAERTDRSAPQDHLYTSHEALLPGWEEALTRPDAETGAWYGTSAHMLWVGHRTRGLDGAHIEYLSGIANPIGVKIGPDVTPTELRLLCERLDPGHAPGRLVLISRLGADRVLDLLPPLVHEIRATGRPVVWACDPMHGNTFRSRSGYKTRRLSDITREIAGFFAVHRAAGTFPGGIHLELSGDDVTECLGGAEEVLDIHLGHRYETACDPRLNAGQSIELAFAVARLLRRHCAT
ncbi:MULTISPECIES: class II 3-deoxy-7-phosphoheptulonate synthase [unclassified Streptosporangium]|uniref:class II 3-deoxy-7-phosphoheptulonate synthase n=1 Tax=unclassified Streptosporangium TaxID=2632669 RepID=UPI002E289E7A|nr:MULTISPECIES: 3-deoxy-7-phosphoheptulonate synthase class II [unclassified Streptosporangium]